MRWRFTSVWCLISISVLGATCAGAESPQVQINLPGFLATHRDQWIDILKHPQVSCVLDHLIPAGEKAALRERLHITSGATILESRDETGGYTVSGTWRAAGGCEEGLLWIHPDGRIYGGTIEGCENISLFTNSTPLMSNPPVSLQEWVHMPGEQIAELSPGWISRSLDPAFPAECSRDTLKERLQAFALALAGEACNDDVDFYSQPVIVRSNESDKTYLFSEPKACPGEPCPQRQKAYLVAGDLVQTGVHRNNFTCIRYQGAQSVTRGWVAQEELRALSVEWPGFEHARVTEALDRVKQWVGGLSGAPSWQGTWQRTYSSLTITQPEDDRFQVEGSASSGYHTGSVEGVLAVDGRIAQLRAEAGGCNLILIRLNNGLFALDDGGCGGYGVSFWGDYYHND